MKLKYQTLHSHTVNSDGKLNYLELINVCEKNNVGVVAFTDHDTLPGQKSINLLKRNVNIESEWIVGIEISSGWPKDLGGGPTSGLHIVGLFVDPFDTKLLEHCKKSKEGRIDRMQKLVKNIKSLGFQISEDDCLKASEGESVGRPHVVAAINSHPENMKVYEKLIEKMKSESVKNETVNEKYKYLLERGEDQYPYILFLSDDSYIPGVYVDYQYYLDFDSSVGLIRNAGGVSILAHWATCRQKMNDEYIEKVFKENRLDGAEIVYGLWNYGTHKWPEQEKELVTIEEIVKRYSKLESGGADAHSLEDVERFSKESWYASKTQGLIEKIIKKSKVDIKWSSFK